MYYVISGQHFIIHNFPKLCTRIDLHKLSLCSSLFDTLIKNERKKCELILIKIFLSADNFSFALQVDSSKMEEEENGAFFDNFFVAFIFQP